MLMMPAMYSMAVMHTAINAKSAAFSQNGSRIQEVFSREAMRNRRHSPIP